MTLFFIIILTCRLVLNGAMWTTRNNMFTSSLNLSSSSVKHNQKGEKKGMKSTTSPPLILCREKCQLSMKVKRFWHYPCPIENILRSKEHLRASGRHVLNPNPFELVINITTSQMVFTFYLVRNEKLDWRQIKEHLTSLFQLDLYPQTPSRSEI